MLGIPDISEQVVSCLFHKGTSNFLSPKLKSFPPVFPLRHFARFFSSPSLSPSLPPSTHSEIYEVLTSGLVNSFVFNLTSIFMHMVILPVCMSMHHVLAEPMEARRRYWILWDWSYRWL